MRWVALVLGVLSTGCVVSLPFGQRLNFNTVSEARKFDARSKGPISLSWDPADFPERVDTQGADGFVGGGSRTRIPTGLAVSQRIAEALDASIGLGASAKRNLKVKVVRARTGFQYSAGIFNVTPAIDQASFTLEAQFDLDGKIWTKTFISELHDPKVGGSSQTGLVEKVWDDVAVQVARDVVEHL